MAACWRRRCRLPRRPGLGAVTSGGPFDAQLGDEEFLALARPMPGAGRRAGDIQPMTVVLRSRTERLRVLRTLRAGLAGTLVVTVLLATVLSYFVARTMTRPLAAVTNAMRDVAATGDLTRKVTLRSRAWDDEDARLLASAFNTLTDSIARFQREAAHKDRLSSLGRLSTVIAHEVRNPLMIIRASLASLWSDQITPTERREALADIDEETRRLNRIVTEVLDFSKPIRFELGETQVNDVCRASSAAAWAGSSAPPVHLDLDPHIPTVMTDAERLRTALVNILTNARHAVEEVSAVAPAPAVVLSTRRHEDRIAVTVRDRGTGIAPDDMAHIFDPFFTTRRAGTGLGLPIAKNIIDGLGGSLSVDSQPDAGTEIRIELPLAAVVETGMSGPRGAVLLVDDEEKILKRLGRALRDEGHDVVEAGSAREAPAQLAQRPFDLFVVDNVMPGMTGLELLRDVFASLPDSERPQVVMMTAHGSTQIVREAFKLGVEDFLEKPFEVDELLGLARRAVRSQPPAD